MEPRARARHDSDTMHSDDPVSLRAIDDNELDATIGGSALGDLWDQVIDPDLRALRDGVRWLSDQLMH
jgi:hypothetical protein